MLINKAKSLLARKAENLNGNDYAEAIRMINLITQYDTVYSWMAKCAESDCDCMLWEDLFETIMPDSSELTEDQGQDLKMFRKDIEGNFSYVNI